MFHALSPLPMMNIASSFLFHAACKFAVGSSLCRNNNNNNNNNNSNNNNTNNTLYLIGIIGTRIITKFSWDFNGTTEKVYLLFSLIK